MTNFLEQWKLQLEEVYEGIPPTQHGYYNSYIIALKGLCASSLKEIWLRHHWDGQLPMDFDLYPPKREKRGVVGYNKPGRDFICMARDSVRVMEVLLSECNS
jgi:hypothetical protein